MFIDDDSERKITDFQNDLEKIEKWIFKNRSELNLNIRFLTEYAVVKSSAIIEVVYKSMIYRYLSSECKDATKRYLAKNIIDQSYNPSTQNMFRILEQFDSRKKEQLDCELDKDHKKADINSLVKLRNDVAHGRDLSSNIDIKNVVKYYNSGISILREIDKILSQDC